MGTSGGTQIALAVLLAVAAPIVGLLIAGRILACGNQRFQSKATWFSEQEFVGAFASWTAEHTDGYCPNRLEDLLGYTKKKDTKDPWGTKYEMKCGDSAPTEAKGFGVISAGKDRKLGTADDIKSWEHQPRS